jgi:thioredoxin 1
MELQTIEHLIQSNQAVMLYFYSDRCAPCVSLRPKVEELIKLNFPLIKLYLIDSEHHSIITGHFGIFANPALLVFFEGNEFMRWSKYVSLQQIESAIDRPYQIIFEAE